MIVAVIAIGVMEVAVHEVINMVAMGNSFMAAVWTVLVFRAVRVAPVSMSAVGRVGSVHIERVLINVAFMQ